MTVDETLLALFRFAREDGFDASAVCAVFAAPGLRLALPELGKAIASGQVTSLRWRGVTDSALPRDFIASMGALWDALVEAELVRDVEGMPKRWTPEAVRLWAYTNEWLLLSQDEDLMLMDDCIIHDLLTVAAESACPKRDYILHVVAHWARDAAFAAAGTDRFSQVVTTVAEHGPAARAAGAAAMAEYFGRLGAYARPGRVSEQAALQRGLDLARCREPEAGSISVERDGTEWRVTLQGHSPKVLRIAESDGRIRS